MRSRTALLASGFAIVLVAGGGTAFAAIASSGPVSSSGIITGCYTNAEINGSHALVLQDAGTTCPKGTTAVAWNEQGPAGATGAAGPAGATGPAGPAGATGPAGPAGSAGATGPSGSAGAGATVTPLAVGNSNCPNGGARVTDGSGDTAYACNGAAGATGATGVTGATGAAGATGATGATGAQGPAGSGGSGACTTDGNAPGTLAASVGSGNAVIWTCVPDSNNPGCDHSNGVGQTYVDCNDALGTPGDAATYNVTMGADAIAAYFGVSDSSVNPSVITNICADGNSVGAEVENSSGQVTGAILWFLTGSMAGQVLTVSGDIFGSGNFGPGDCTEVALGSWD